MLLAVLYDLLFGGPGSYPHPLLGLIVLGLRGAFRPVIRDWLRVADRLGQHQAQLILRHGWLPRGR